jgi:hypothetical protein
MPPEPMPLPRPQRVLHVLKYYRPEFTGEGVFLERCSAVMQEIAPGVEHDLLVTHTPAPTGDTAEAACSTLRRVIYLTRGRFSALALWWWMATNLWRYRTVHFRTHADWHFVSYALARLFGCRLVLSATLDDSLPVLIAHYRPSLRGIARRGFALFHADVGISPKLDAETRVMAPAERCHLIPCGITTPAQPLAVRQAIRNGYVGHLPAALECEWAGVRRETIAERFGECPRIFRAGRFGAGRRTGDALERLGYLAGSSVAVCWPPTDTDRARAGWPLFAELYWLDRERTLMEMPAPRAAGRPVRRAAGAGGVRRRRPPRLERQAGSREPAGTHPARPGRHQGGGS